jgi:biotin carboxyl carrier protein
VRKGTGLLVLEAMKMENEIQAPLDGMVDEVLVEPGQTVESGAELVRITPAEP